MTTSEDFDERLAITNPERFEEMAREAVAFGKRNGWIKDPGSSHQARSESSPAVNVARKNQAQPGKKLHPVQNRSL